MQGSKTIAIAVLGVAIIGTAVWFNTGSDEKAQQETETNTTETATATPVDQPKAEVPVIGRCSLLPGMLFAHQVRTEINTMFDPAAYLAPDSVKTNQNVNRSKVEISSEMHWKVLGSSPEGGWVVAIQFPDLTLTTDTGEKGGATYQDPMLARVETDCSFGAFGFQKEISTNAGGLLRRTMYLMEFQLSADENAKSWQTRQHDDTGEYRAAYRREAATVSRARMNYTNTWPPSDGTERIPGLKFVIESSGATAELAEGGKWFKKMRVKERQSNTIKGKTATSARISLRAEAIDVANKLENFEPDPKDYVWIDTSKAPPPEASYDKIPEHIARMSPDELIAAYADALRSKDPNGFGTALDYLIHYMKAHPQFALEMMKKIKDGTLDKDLQSIVFLALEKIGTPEAQHVLNTALMDQEMSEMSRSRAAVALMDVARPTQETINTMMEASKAERGEDPDGGTASATLGLGSLEERLNGLGERELAKQIHDDISERLKTTESSGERTELLGAIGNSGNEDYLDDIEGMFKVKEPMVRGAAAMAMRRMDPGKTANLFGPLMGGEENWIARGAIVESFYEQAKNSQEPPLDSIIEVALANLGKESSVKVRGQLIELLGLAANSNPNARKGLATHFSVEKNPDLLVMIGKYVQAFELKGK